MSKGSHSREEANAVASKVFDSLDHLCEKIMVCGSIRRMRPVVGDVDTVAVAHNQDEVMTAFYNLGRLDKKGSKVTGHIILGGIQVDLWLVPLESWGAAISFATGPMEENVRLRRLAKSKGWKLSQYGLFDASTGENLASETEEEIYLKLGVQFVPPAMRDVSSGRLTRHQNEEQVRRCS